MKIFRLSVLLLFLLGCEETPEYVFTVFELNQVTVSPAGEPFGVRTENGNTMTVNTVELTDSRCPINVLTCTKYGDYRVELEIVQGLDTAIVSLCNGDCNSNVEIMDSVQFTLKNIPYWIRMRSLLPFPNTARPDIVQNITFEVFLDKD